MDFETLLVAGLVIAIVGGAGAAAAVIVLADRLKRQPLPPETQDDFTAAVLKWGDMQDRARK
jgi:hypothetical protein